MIINKSKDCPYCGPGHSNYCYMQYENGSHCFSCGGGTSNPENYYAYNPRQLPMAARSLVKPIHDKDIKNFSLTVLEWLYKYYVYEDLIKQYNIAYCEPQARRPESLLFPILDELGQLTDYQQRFFPKGFYSTSGIKKCEFVTKHVDTNKIVLVEDYISAIRVGEACQTMCLFGTSLGINHLNYLLDNCSIVYIWLDNDEPGINAAEKIFNKIQKEYERTISNYAFSMANPIMLRVIKSEKQPKEYSLNEIKDYIL